MQPQKTVADIWNEVREEQRRFNNVLKYLFAALIAAFLVAAIAAYLSWTSLNDVNRAAQLRVDNAAAEMDISASEAKRRSEELRGETIRIREQLDEQRRYVDMEKRVDNALAVSAPQRTAGTIDALVMEAVQVAESAAMGSPLNDATAYLVRAFSDEANRNGNATIIALLTDDQRRLLDVVYSDWEMPEAPATREAWVRLSRDGTSRQARGLGFAGLGLAYYRDAEKPANSLGWDKGCREAVEYITEARRLGIRSGPLLLSQGECQRKNGDKVAAFTAFLDALTLQSEIMSTEGAVKPSLNEQRKAAHGAGTTLIAIQAAASADPALQARLQEFTNAVSALPLLEKASQDDREACPQDVQDGQQALLQACLLLERAADLRTERGEGEISRIYTRENIGFIHLLNRDWARAETHAREIDEELTAAWNLTVLIIALDMLAEEAENAGESRDAARYNADATFYRNKLSYLSVADLDEAEIRKLLHPDFGPKIDSLKLSMKSE